MKRKRFALAGVRLLTRLTATTATVTNTSVELVAIVAAVTVTAKTGAAAPAAEPKSTSSTLALGNVISPSKPHSRMKYSQITPTGGKKIRDWPISVQCQTMPLTSDGHSVLTALLTKLHVNKISALPKRHLNSVLIGQNDNIVTAEACMAKNKHCNDMTSLSVDYGNPFKTLTFTLPH